MLNISTFVFSLSLTQSVSHGYSLVHILADTPGIWPFTESFYNYRIFVCKICSCLMCFQFVIHSDCQSQVYLNISYFTVFVLNNVIVKLKNIFSLIIFLSACFSVFKSVCLISIYFTVCLIFNIFFCLSGFKYIFLFVSDLSISLVLWTVCSC